jgi:hypothetical protein
MNQSVIPCGFCLKPLLLRYGGGRSANNGIDPTLCEHCGAAAVISVVVPQVRDVLGNALHMAGARLQLSVSPRLTDVAGRQLHFICAWDPAEMLTTVRVARILEVHRVTVQQHVRQGRFPGAVLSADSRKDSRGYWQIPRAALEVYLRGKGKSSFEQADAKLLPSGGE